MSHLYDQIVSELDKARSYLIDNPAGEVEVLIATLGDKMIAEVIITRVLKPRFPEATFTYVYS